MITTPPLIPKHADTYFYAPGFIHNKTLVPCSPCRRAPEGQGQRLPYQIIPAILRAFRSKYAPHVGKKQEAKAASKQEQKSLEAAYAEFDRWSTPTTGNP